jgi:hypothetical protein
MYLASLRTSFSWTPFRIIFYRSDRFFQTPFTGSFAVLRTQISFTGFYRKLYGHGIQSFLLCVLSIVPSVTSLHTTDSFVVLGLYAVLPIALTIVHFGGTSILSLHTTHACLDLY